MANFLFKRVTKDVENRPFSCGVTSIDEYVRESYYSSIIQHAYAYSIQYGARTVGYYQILFREIKLEDFPESISDYISDIKDTLSSLHIRYLAIDEKYQKHGIGTAVLKGIVGNVMDLSEKWPIRVVTIDARIDLVEWYNKIGFQPLMRNTEGQDGVTIAMYYDVMHHDKELSDYLDY